MPGPERPRPSRPAALGGAAWGLVWVLVIALGSSLVWVVISSAGSGVSETLETSTVATVPVEVTLPPAVSPHPSRSPSSSSSSAPVECRGSAVSLVGAYPSADGWVVEVKDRGPERVEAEFEGRGEQEGAETRVRAECVSGVPEFEERAESD